MTRSRWWASFALLLFAALALLGRPRPAASASAQATARGLDLWVHGNDEVVAGGTLTLDLVAVGFPTIRTVTALDGATIRAAWDVPTLLGERTSAPPEVEVTADANGRARLVMPVPEGPEGNVTLVLSLRSGDRERVREIGVRRLRPYDLRLFASDDAVVPGSEVAVWAHLTTRAGHLPVPGRAIEVRLLEGGLDRHRVEATTDGAGTVLVRIPIPRDDAPGLSWELAAREVPAPGSGTAEIARDPAARRMSLAIREERPGTPELTSSFEAGSVRAGAEAAWTVRLRDATRTPVAGHAVWVWTGPRGTSAPADDDAFQKVASRVVTDGAGQATGKIKAPGVVPLRGTEVQLEARVEFEGQRFDTKRTIDVSSPRGSVDLTPEAGQLVPGLEQEVAVVITGDLGSPIRGTFEVRGDGLSTSFSTNDQGEGAFTWKAPREIGASRNVGPCSGGVAAAVSLRATSATDARGAFDGALTGTDGLSLCVPVDREASMLVRPARRVVRAGERLPLTLLGAGKAPLSLTLARRDGGAAATAFVDGDAAITLPEDLDGVVTIDAATFEGARPARVASAPILVVPRVIASLEAKVAGGRPVPGGSVEVHARLADEAGRPLAGSVAAVVIDAFGGGSVSGLQQLDATRALCGQAGAPLERCAEVLSGKDGARVLVLSNLANRARGGQAPQLDPGNALEATLDETFKTVVQSLEGAVYEASQEPATLLDVRRSERGRHAFNPELMTLVTQAMDTPPTTPGGEPVELRDLLAIDPQVTFDAVARRIARLKLFEILREVRTYREGIDPDEPVLKQPNAILARLARDERLSAGQLTDPWGGRIAFVETNDPPTPFLTVTRGWALHAPGPDGRLGTADDVRDPFERVLKSGSPYARAVDEDRLVDARWDMRVADSTVDAWDALLKETTGTSLGTGGIGLMGVGSGGGGTGYGVGMGRVGTVGHGGGRGTFGVAKGLAHVALPVRTDADGRVKLTIPLGDEETTWRVALVGLPDKARPAVSTVDVASGLPLSVKVSAGARWVSGDEGQVALRLRNRTDADLEVELVTRAEGALASPEQRRTVRVGKQGAETVTVPVRAGEAGTGRVIASVRASGVAEDRVTHAVEVAPRGEPVVVARTTWLDPGRSVDLGRWLERAGLRGLGPATVVLERGEATTFGAALDALDPSSLELPESLADAAEAAAAIERYATVAQGDEGALTQRARALRARAVAKALVLATGSDATSVAAAGRALREAPAEVSRPGKGKRSCPEEKAALGTAIEKLPSMLAAEPPPEGGVPADCWTTFVGEATNRLGESREPATVARGVLALSSSPHRAQDARVLLDALVAQVGGGAGREPSLPAGSSRATRSLVLAALLHHADASGPRERARLAQWLLLQRDARGSFGTPAATRAAVVALVREAGRHGAAAKTPSQVTLAFDDAAPRTVPVLPGQRLTFPAPAGARRILVATESGAVTARLERTYLRPFETPAQPEPVPLQVALTWPDAKRARVGLLRVDLTDPSGLRGTSSQIPADVRIPLPPGAQLAGDVSGVRQVQGAIRLRTTVSGKATVTVPIRFGLAGSFTLPETTLTSADAPGFTARSPARRLVVAP